MSASFRVMGALLLCVSACTNANTSANTSATGEPADASGANAVPDGVGASGCNMENPAVMAKYDPSKRCFEDPAPVAGICNGTTSEGEGTGGLACAFSADGTAYAETVCENCGLSGAGFRYSQFVFNSDMPDTPAGEEATAAQVSACAAFSCVPLCSNGQPFGVSHFGDPIATECADAGTSDAALSDASDASR